MSLIHRPIMGLGLRTVATGILFKRTDIQYDYALAGIPLLAATSKAFPFRRNTSDFRKDQFDNSRDPGEQSLSGWWLRSQSTFHFGAGTKFMEPSADDEVMGSFHTSVGVDPWTPGLMQLLKQTQQARGGSSASLSMGAIDGSTDVYFQADGANLFRDTAIGVGGSVAWGGANTIASLANDGANYLAADSVGIYRGTLAGGAGSKLWNTGNASVVIGWVKQRLVAGIGAAVYELVGGAPPTLPTALYTHPTTGWQWTSITEGPAAIYMAGYVGSTSAIYKFTLSSAGAMPTLTSGTTACTLPTGERVHSIYAYVGSFIAIGTNKGVRIGEIDSNGNIAYGPLVVESTQPVLALVGKDRFVFAGCTNQINGNSGLWRIDLGNQRNDGRFPFATDLQSMVTGAVSSVSLFGSSDRLLFGVTGRGTYLEHATDLETSGYFETPLIRYNTVENKVFKFVSTRTSSLSGGLTIETVDVAGSTNTVITLGPASGVSGDIDLGRTAPEEALALKFTLLRSLTNATVGAQINSWQVKSLPAIRRSRDILVPILLFESMADSKGTRVPVIDPLFILGQLETMEDTAAVVPWSTFGKNPRVESVTIQKIEFTETGPPPSFEGEGGIAYLTLRTVQ